MTKQTSLSDDSEYYPDSQLDCAECGKALTPASAEPHLQCTACSLACHVLCSSRLFPSSAGAQPGGSGPFLCRMCSASGRDSGTSGIPAPIGDATCLFCEQPLLTVSPSRLRQCPACLLAVHVDCLGEAEAAQQAGAVASLFGSSSRPPFCQLCASLQEKEASPEHPVKHPAAPVSARKRPAKREDEASAAVQPKKPAVAPDGGSKESLPSGSSSRVSEATPAEDAKNSDDNDKGLCCIACDDPIPAGAVGTGDALRCPSCRLAAHARPECSAELFNQLPKEPGLSAAVVCRVCDTASGGTDDTPADAELPPEDCPMCLTPMPDQVATPDCCPQHRFCPPCLRGWAANTRICPLDRRPFRQLVLRPRRGPATAVVARERVTGSANADALPAGGTWWT